MKIERLTKKFGDRYLFEEFSLEILDGEITCILGESGVGKTTLLNAICSLVDFDGEILPKERKCAYVFQEARLLPFLSVRENLRLIGATDTAIDEMLIAIGLEDKSLQKCESLSGGEKQRVAIARAFLYDAPILLMDEPFSSLDTALKVKLSQLFIRLWENKKEQNKTCVFVTHDLEEAFMIADRIIVLGGGGIKKDVRLEKGEKPRVYGSENKLKIDVLNVLLGK